MVIGLSGCDYLEVWAKISMLLDRLRTEHIEHDFPGAWVNVQTQPCPFCNIVFKLPCIVFEVLGDIPLHWFAIIWEEIVVPVAPWLLFGYLHSLVPMCDNGEGREWVPGIQNPVPLYGENENENAKPRQVL